MKDQENIPQLMSAKEEPENYLIKELFIASCAALVAADGGKPQWLNVKEINAMTRIPERTIHYFAKEGRHGFPSAIKFKRLSLWEEKKIMAWIHMQQDSVK